MSEIVTAHSVTRIGPTLEGAVLATGSHGGRYPAFVAVRAGFRAVVFNDASIGRECAGVAGVEWLDQLGVAAVAVSHLTARIGNGNETLQTGVLSTVNGPAALLGCYEGESAISAAIKLRAARPFDGHLEDYGIARHLFDEDTPSVAILDSASIVESADRRRIVVTGSHGALLGDEPATALKIETLGAFYSDAGRGPDARGTTRLPVLAKCGIPAMTVDAATARIGNGMSIYNDGVVSVVNAQAAEFGVRPGFSVRAAVQLLQKHYRKMGCQK